MSKPLHPGLRFIVIVLTLNLGALAQSAEKTETPPEQAAVGVSRGQLVKAAKLYFRDTAELPMVQVTTVTVTGAAGKIRKPINITGEYLFHGYSKNKNAANATFRTKVSMWTALRGSKTAKTPMNGIFFTMMPGLQIYSETDDYAFQDDAGPQEAPKLKLLPVKPCPVFSVMQISESYLPEHPCGEMGFDLDKDSKLQKFTFESAGLPAQLELHPFGKCTLLRYHAEVTFQSVTLLDEKTPFLVPAQVTTTVETSKGTVVLVSEYRPKP
ncbi:MAG TPA: hypothetical protein VFR08_15285 [Candidatus Angelobacter sp.]|nr:hypothetical protein [Candidatus Angelobacter sp.]